ncbi:endolytic transglycosylase MltG [Amnibacterium flavum]|uniref:Endolytic murein transglycosylase n=1 Tax=Amnibacterium flavum TaxID=2173173 RepID=A0A2V1HRR5_9MICO|nr:endolytic transglycosylase MltG [Amnibacterium flavum]PVZ94352.1 endolytic transglycosylase MltG [Amnibacterium flavum]
MPPETPPQRGYDDDRATVVPPTWSELLGDEGAREREAAPEIQASSRRELREQEAARASADPGRGSGQTDLPIYGFDGDRPRKKRRWLPWVLTPLITLIVIGGGGTAAAFLIMPDWPTRLEALLAGPEELDYTGSGEGDVVVVIRDGDIGEDVAKTLVAAGVTKTFDAFYQLLLVQETDPGFQPGAYKVKLKMSAQSALDALLDPANKIENQVVLPEGETLSTALSLLAAALQVPVEEVQAAAADYGSYGLPAEATSLEGFIFPATYQFDPGTSPHDALQAMVNRSFQALDEAGVAPENRWRTVVLASLIQKEAGLRDDYYKVSRVFLNRLDQGMLLQSDATVAYGTGNTHRVATTDDERADGNNPYNTYVHEGLPVGPISNPGDLAIDAALHPADGPWLFFVTVNLDSGETVFSETVDEHEVAVDQWLNWMDEHPEYQ